MRELLFTVEENPDGGFVARSSGGGIITQGATLNELRLNIREAVLCHFEKPEDRPKLLRLRRSRTGDQ